MRKIGRSSFYFDLTCTLKEIVLIRLINQPKDHLVCNWVLLTVTESKEVISDLKHNSVIDGIWVCFQNIIITFIHPFSPGFDPVLGN